MFASTNSLIISLSLSLSRGYCVRTRFFVCTATHTTRCIELWIFKMHRHRFFVALCFIRKKESECVIDTEKSRQVGLVLFRIAEQVLHIWISLPWNKVLRAGGIGGSTGYDSGCEIDNVEREREIEIEWKRWGERLIQFTERKRRFFWVRGGESRRDGESLDYTFQNIRNFFYMDISSKILLRWWGLMQKNKQKDTKTMWSAYLSVQICICSLYI